MDFDDLFFEPGFQWSGMFVKHATYRGRSLAFRLSPQLVANCLDPVPGAVGPIRTIEAQEPAIETACRQAMRRHSAMHPTIDLKREDFTRAA
jgi:hypothetical protein